MLVDMMGYVLERCPQCGYRRPLSRRTAHDPRNKYHHKLDRALADAIRQRYANEISRCPPNLLAKRYNPYRAALVRDLAVEFRVTEVAIKNVIQFLAYRPPWFSGNHKGKRKP